MRFVLPLKDRLRRAAPGGNLPARSRTVLAVGGIVSLTLLALCALRAAGQDVSDPVIASQGGNPRGMLIVYLVGENGTAITGSAVVTILRAGEVSGPHEMTGSNGVARFSQLANATYTVIVSIAGYKDARTEADITPSNTVSEVTITMERAAQNPDEQGNAKGIVLAPNVKKEAQKGIDAMRAGHYDEAEKHLKAAYALAPGNPDLNDRMGELFLMTKDYDKAQSYLAKALSLDPDNVSALTDTGWLRVQEGDNADAEIALLRATTLDAQRWFPHWVLGLAYLRDHQYEKARAEAASAVKAGKGAAVEAEYLLGESLAALGRNDDAIKVLQDFLRDAPKDSNAEAAQTLIANLRVASPSGASQSSPKAPVAPDTSAAQPSPSR